MTEPDLSYQVFALSLEEKGAIRYFSDNLPLHVLQKIESSGRLELYRAFLEFYEVTGSDPVDRAAFCSWLKDETDIYEALGGIAGVNSYLDAALDVPQSRPEVVTSLLKYRYNKVEQLQLLLQLQNELSQDHMADSSRIEELTQEIQKLNRGFSDPLASVYDGETIAESADLLWELPNFIPTPYPSLNKALGYSETTGGVCRQGVYAVLAPSGAGKSTLTRCFMSHWVDQGYTVLFVNYEEPKEHWERILFTQITKQNVYIGKEKLTQSQRTDYTKTFKNKMREWKDRFLVKHDMETPYFEDLESWVRILADKKKLDIVIIDTIQSLFLKGARNLPRWGQYEEMMVRLEKLAKDLDIVIIITAQENRDRMKERREVVQQSDVGGSLAIVQKCSATIFITKAKDNLRDDSMDEHIMQLQIPKNRITGTTFMMDPPSLRYEDSTKSYYEHVELAPEGYQGITNIDDDWSYIKEYGG